MAKSIYEARLAEVRNPSRANGRTASIWVPRFLWEEWQRRKKSEGLKTPLTDLISDAMHFGLFGPHSYTDPVDGLREAIDSYVAKTEGTRGLREKAVKEVAEKLGVKVEIKKPGASDRSA